MDMKRLNLSLDRTDKGHEETFLKPAKVDAGDIRWQFLIPTQEMTSESEYGAERLILYGAALEQGGFFVWND